MHSCTLMQHQEQSKLHEKESTSITEMPSRPRFSKMPEILKCPICFPDSFTVTLQPLPQEIALSHI